MVKYPPMIDNSIYHFTFLRHGESVGNAEDRFQGHADFPLTDKVRSEARSLAERWQNDGVTFDQCITSPLQRARQTTEIICDMHKIPIESDPDWLEINKGLVSGLTPDQAALGSPQPDFMTPYTHFGATGESRWELYLRAGRAIQHILDQSPGRYLVAAHGGVMNMVLYAILGIPIQADSAGPRFRFHNATFAIFTYEPESRNWRMLQFDDCPH